MEKASVIIPVRDREAELRRALRSVLAQTYSDLEIIVVENNSVKPSSVCSVVCEFKDDRIKYHSLRPCKNANVARNFGMAVAESSYIAFLDSDDEYQPDHLADSIQFIKENSLDFCFGSMRVYDGEKYRIAKARSLRQNETGLEYFFTGKGYEAPTPTYVLTKRVSKLSAWDEELERHQDWDFFLGLLDRFKGDAKVEPSVIVHWTAGRRVHLPVSSVQRFYDRWRKKMTARARRNFLLSKAKEAIRTKNAPLFFWASSELFGRS